MSPPRKGQVGGPHKRHNVPDGQAKVERDREAHEIRREPYPNQVQLILGKVGRVRAEAWMTHTGIRILELRVFKVYGGARKAKKLWAHRC